MKAFLEAFPKSDEEPEVLFQLASNNEFNGDEKEARDFYTRLVAEYPEALPGRKAAGAILRRLDSVGKPIALKGKTADGQTIDLGAAPRQDGARRLLGDLGRPPVGSDMPEIAKIYEKNQGQGLRGRQHLPRQRPDGAWATSSRRAPCPGRPSSSRAASRAGSGSSTGSCPADDDARRRRRQGHQPLDVRNCRRPRHPARQGPRRQGRRRRGGEGTERRSHQCRGPTSPAPRWTCSPAAPRARRGEGLVSTEVLRGGKAGMRSAIAGAMPAASLESRHERPRHASTRDPMPTPGLPEWRDHARRGGEGPGLGPRLPLRRLDLRGLPPLRGPALARSRARRAAPPEPGRDGVPAGRPRRADAPRPPDDRRERGPEGTAYIQVTRGVAPRSHAFPDPPVPPTELIIVRRYDDAPTARAPRVGRARHQPRRPPLGPVRRQVDQPAGQRASPSNTRSEPGPTRRSSSAATGSSPRRRTPRSSGSATAASKGRPTAPRSCRGRSGTSSSRCAGRPRPVRRGADHARRAEGGRRGDPARDDDRGPARGLDRRPGRRRRRARTRSPGGSRRRIGPRSRTGSARRRRGLIAGAHAREPRLGPPARRDGQARAAGEGGRARRRHGRRGPGAGRGDRRRARQAPLPARAEGDRRSSSGPTSTAGTGPWSMGCTGSDEPIVVVTSALGPVVGRATSTRSSRRSTPATTRSAAGRGRPSAGSPGDCAALPVSAALRRAGRRPLLAAPDASPRGPGRRSRSSRPRGFWTSRSWPRRRSSSRRSRRSTSPDLPSPEVGSRRGRPRRPLLAPDPPPRRRRAELGAGLDSAASPLEGEGRVGGGRARGWHRRAMNLPAWPAFCPGHPPP